MTAPFSFADVSGGYGDTLVLRGASASVAPGQVLGILGRNGVGKTTLMRLLMGYLPCATGTVRLGAQELAGLSVHARVRAGLCHAPQEGVVFDGLSVRDNLTLHRPRRVLEGYEPMLEMFPRIGQRLRQPAGSLSGGEKKLVSFARCWADARPVTLLDEPTEGVQQENIALMARAVRQRAAAGAIHVIVEQNLEFLLRVMDQVLVLDQGTVVHRAGAPFERAVLERHLQV